MRAGLITHTHSSGAPLPLPMRVSRGFLVYDLSGKTRIQILPPRLTWRVIAIRAASICWLVNQQRPIDFRAYSPKLISVLPFAVPAIEPRCTLRCLTLLGANISDLPGARRPRRQVHDPRR